MQKQDWRAFAFVDKPYDYDFDFLSDQALVCSEVIYKAYAPSELNRGLELPVSSVLGRYIMPPNEIARIYDEQFGTEGQQFELVTFIDGSNPKMAASEKGSEAFRLTWKLPKWHLVQKGSGPRQVVLQ